MKLSEKEANFFSLRGETEGFVLLVSLCRETVVFTGGAKRKLSQTKRKKQSERNERSEANNKAKSSEKKYFEARMKPNEKYGSETRNTETKRSKKINTEAKRNEKKTTEAKRSEKKNLRSENIHAVFCCLEAERKIGSKLG